MSIYLSDYFTTGRGKALAHKGTGARSRRMARIREAMPFVNELHELAGEMNGVSWARHDSDEGHLWLALPISMNNREDDVLATSNYYAARAAIDQVSAFGTDYRKDAWPGGVIHTLTVRADDALALHEAEKLVAALQDYPILDEMDYSDREWSASHPSEGDCHADECSCDVAEKREEAEYHEAVGHLQILSDAIASDGYFMPELDENDEWFCEVCDAHIWFSEDDKTYLANVWLRHEHLDMERKSQLKLDI